MKQTLVIAGITSLTMGLAACGSEEPADNTNTSQSSSVEAAQQAEISVVDKLQNAVTGASDTAVHVANSAAEKSKEMSEGMVAKTNELAADGQIKLAEYKTNVSSSTTIDKVKAAGAKIATRTSEMVDDAKVVGQNAFDKGKEVGTTAMGKTRSALDDTGAAGSGAIYKGKALMKGQDGDAVEIEDASPEKPQSSINFSDENMAGALPVAALATDNAPSGLKKEALNAQIDQLESALEALEKAAGDARDAASALKRSSQG